MNYASLTIWSTRRREQRCAKRGKCSGRCWLPLALGQEDKGVVDDGLFSPLGCCDNIKRNEILPS